MAIDTASVIRKLWSFFPFSGLAGSAGFCSCFRERMPSPSRFFWGLLLRRYPWSRQSNRLFLFKFSLVSQICPNLPLIFIIGIPGKTSQFHALHVIQCAAKRLTMDTDLLLGCFGLFGFKASAFLATNLLAVQPGCQKTFTGTLVQIGNFFFGLLKGQLDLLLCQGHQILVDAL